MTGGVTHTVTRLPDGRFFHALDFALANESRLELVTPGPETLVRDEWETGVTEGNFTQWSVKHIDVRGDLVWRLARGELARTTP